jgi:hypothetical protein
LSERLGSWTRTLNEEDAIAVLLATTAGQTLAEWEAHGHEILPQASRARRLETLRMVRDALLDRDGDRIVRSTWLRLFQEGSPGRRLNLLYGRFHARRAWILRAIAELVLPQLAQADEPLAPHDADLITGVALADFFARNLAENTPGEASKKTRSVLQRNLADLGILALDGAGAPEAAEGPKPRRPTGAPREMRVRHAEPDPLAFGWLLGHELRTDGRAEAPASWAASESIAARLFATRRAYAEHCVEAAVGAGLLARGYLAGVPRLHPLEDR